MSRGRGKVVYSRNNPGRRRDHEQGNDTKRKMRQAARRERQTSRSKNGLGQDSNS